jgi:hypothetical protein
MDILLAEGIDYFLGHLEEFGAIRSDVSNFWAFHSTEQWDSIVILFNGLPCSYLVHGFDLIRTTKMKNGQTNYVFLIVYPK